ncbi:hypothetical protein AB0O70_13020 [Microbacterium paraoxydans]|jgi:hypothetical protein|uniref:hypothetical protein n=1 Tax=Microbacterium TaxID=33882 RepID=UPI001C30B0A3
MRREWTCEKTGLHLVSDSGAYCFHVGKTEYPPLSAITRETDPKWRDGWNRYDVPGQTFYVAETRQCAYAEVLAPFKRANGSADPLTKDAESMAMTLEEFVEEVARDWSERDFMGLGAIPAGWRYDRGMIPVVLPENGWFIDIEHPDSMAAIERLMELELSRLGVPQLTTGVLRGEERSITTAIAANLHDVVLNNFEKPLGIHFGSKHGAAWCKALWLDHPAAGDVLTLSPDPILVTDDALKVVAERFRIKVF